MPVDLTGHLDKLVRRVDQQVHTAAADAMAEAFRDSTARAMGGDLSFSGGAGTVRIDGDAHRGRVVVTVGGAFRLADQGRRRVVPATAKGRALRTPYGPRRSVKGSTWRGFGITQRYGREALRAGMKAVVDDVKWGH